MWTLQWFTSSCCCYCQLWCGCKVLNFIWICEWKVFHQFAFWLFCGLFSAAEFLSSRSSFLLHRWHIHCHWKALLQPTKRTPISSGFIDDATVSSTYINRESFLECCNLSSCYTSTYQCKNTKIFVLCSVWRNKSNRHSKKLRNVFHSIYRRIHYMEHLHKFSSVLLLVCLLLKKLKAKMEIRKFNELVLWIFSPFASIPGRVMVSFNQSLTNWWCFYSHKTSRNWVCQRLERSSSHH